MKFKKLESGRSMVEMLGVLAIIGVLSVGGIAGYSLSMRRHRANQIADLATKYSMVVYDYAQKNPFWFGNTGASFCGSPEDTDLGQLPPGVNKMGGNCTVSKDSNGEEYVEFSALFDDDKLCQAVGAIMGSSCQEKRVYFHFKYN